MRALLPVIIRTALPALTLTGCALVLPRPDTAHRVSPERLTAARPAPSSPACVVSRTTPEAAGIAGPMLDSLLAGARASDSDALVVLRDGRVAFEWYFDADGATRRRYAQSVSKSITTLAIGTLVDDGSIPSLDAPLGTFFPEWR